MMRGDASSHGLGESLDALIPSAPALGVARGHAARARGARLGGARDPAAAGARDADRARPTGEEPRPRRALRTRVDLALAAGAARGAQVRAGRGRGFRERYRVLGGRAGTRSGRARAARAARGREAADAREPRAPLDARRRRPHELRWHGRDIWSAPAAAP